MKNFCRDKKILIWSASKSPGHLQTVNAWIEVINNFKENKISAHRITRFKDLFSYSQRKTKIIIYSPSLQNIPFAFMSKILGYEIYKCMHEPFPMTFVLERNLKSSIQEIIKTLFITYIYNPIILLLTDGVIYPSKTASLILKSSFMGIIVKLFNKREYFINLIMPKFLNDYRSKTKETKVCIAGSLNKDKGLEDIIKLSNLNPDIKFSILCTRKALKNLYSDKDFKRIKNQNTNLEFKIRNKISDAEIYDHISSSLYIILFYSHITQSQVLPIALCTGTIPIFTDLIYFKEYCFDVSDSVLIWNLMPGLKNAMNKINTKKASKNLINLYQEKYEESVKGLKEITGI